MMCEEIESRQITFSAYGIAVTKTWGRSRGINPVWYLDISRRGAEWLTAVDDARVWVLVGLPGDGGLLIHARLGPVADPIREDLLELRQLLAGERDRVVIGRAQRPQLALLLVGVDALAPLHARRGKARLQERRLADLAYTGDDDLLHLIVEIKGYRGEDAKEKKATMETQWVPGVNNLGTHGRWDFLELRDVYQIQVEFNAKVEAACQRLLASGTGASST